MNVQVPHFETASADASFTRAGVIDCDIHLRVRTIEDLRPWLSDHWMHYLRTYGVRQRHGFAKSAQFPKAAPSAARRDAWPPGGGPPGSDLPFLREQHLDPYDIAFGIINPLVGTGQGDQNDDLSAAMATAANEWQLETFVRHEPRLKASVVVPYENGPACAAEIARRAGDRRFAHILMLSRTGEPTGKRRYWPIYQAAVEADLPIGIHVFGYSGWSMTNSGWGSYYIEEMTEHSTSCQAMVTSMIMEGVLDAFPKLRILLIECGFGWLPSLGWRLDKLWSMHRAELPHVRRPPSEYLRENFWVSTQPMEEPEHAEHLHDMMGWVGWERLLFASDYPHWDFDDPQLTLPHSIDPDRRQAILAGNARELYGLG